MRKKCQQLEIILRKPTHTHSISPLSLKPSSNLESRSNLSTFKSEEKTTFFAQHFFGFKKDY